MTASPSTATPSPSQGQALAAFDEALKSSDECFILHGGAGTGKTRMIAWLVALAAKAERSVALLTPTGRAASAERANRAGRVDDSLPNLCV